MSEEQDFFDPSNEEARTEDSAEYSESGDTDFDEPLLHEHTNHMNQPTTANVASPVAVVVTVAVTVQAPLTSLKCVHCDRIRVNVRMFTCKSGHLVCGTCVQFPTEGSFRIWPRCAHCNEDAEPNTNADQQIEDLSVKCRHCEGDFRNFYLAEHEANMCHKRPVSCKYKIGGCQWRGVAAEQSDHEIDCSVQYKSGAEITEALEASLAPQAAVCHMKDLLMLLSQPIVTNCNLINVRLLKKTTPAEENFAWYYESTVFPAANLLWFIKAKVVQRINQAAILEFALKLTSCIQSNVEYHVFYAALGGQMNLKPLVLEHNFHAHSTETAYQRLFEFEAEFKKFEAPITFRLMLSSK